MKTFDNLRFKKQQELVSIGMNKWYANLDINNYTISVIYGDSCYGGGPNYDTYEVAVFERDHEDPVPLQNDQDTTVLGWVNHEEINALMKILHTEPNFGEACRVLHRTKYIRRFSGSVSRILGDTIA